MKEDRHAKRRATAEDIEIGSKIRALRLQRGLSQSGLAQGIDLTFQQVQKYEKGMNRVSAGRLQRIADLLNAPVMFFYGGMGARPKKDQRNSSLAFVQTNGAMRLMRAYSEIGSRTTKYTPEARPEGLSGLRLYPRSIKDVCAGRGTSHGVAGGTCRCCRTLPFEARLGGCQRRIRNVESDQIDVRGRIALRKLRIGDGAGEWCWRGQNRGLGCGPGPAGFVAVAEGHECADEQHDAGEESQLEGAAEDRDAQE